MPKLFEEETVVISGGGGAVTVEGIGTFVDAQLAPAFTALEFAADLSDVRLAPAVTDLEFAADLVGAQLAPAMTELEFAADPADARLAPAMTELEFAAASADAQLAPAMTELEFAANPADAQLAPAMTELEFGADPADARLAPAFTSLDFSADLVDAQLAPAFTTLEFAANPADVQLSPAALTTLEFAATLANAGLRIGQYTVDVTDMEATADCYYQNIAGCVGGGNNNADPLITDGQTGSRRDMWMRFPVNNLQPGATIDVAFTRIRLVLHTTQGAIQYLGDGQFVATGSENWTETTPTCNAPLVSDGVTTVITVNGGTAAGTEIVLGIVGNTFSAAWNTRMEANIGVRSMTFGVFGRAAALANAQFHDRTDATAANRPRLDCRFTVTL